MKKTAEEIADAPDSRIRVMAGPGTGKSTAMKLRVARIIKDGGDPARILAVTLTRNAARELVRDLKDELKVPGCEKIRVGTLHGYCLGLLQTTGFLQAKTRSTRLLMRFEDRSLLADLARMGGFGGISDCGKRVKAFEAAWARLQTDAAGWPTDEVDKRFHAAMVDWLKFHGALRVGEVVPLALEYLKSNPSCEELAAFDHVVVDEYQDLNKSEQELIRLLAMKGDLAVVGDIDQSIYTFRHAHPEGIRDFHQLHPGTRDYVLSECRRCPTKVVELANTLIKNNHEPAAGERLAPCPGNDVGVLRIVQWNSLEQELIGIGDCVKRMIARGIEPKDIMVLCPNKDLGRELRNSLRTGGVQAHSFYAEDALDSIQAQERLAILALLVDPSDRVALRFALGSRSGSSLSGEYATLRRHCDASGKSPREMLDSILAGSHPGVRMSHIITRYRDIVEMLGETSGLLGGDLAEKLFPAAEDWAKPVREIVDRILDSQTTAEDIFDELIVALTQPEMPSEGAYVRIMSLHKSKGLASPVVIVVSCVQGVIPKLPRDKVSAEEERRILEEQRRLFYVAMTRSRRTLILSSAVTWPRNRAHRVGIRLVTASGTRIHARTVASQFLHELGPGAPPAITGEAFLHELR